MRKKTLSPILLATLITATSSGYAQMRHFKVSISGGYEYFHKDQPSGKNSGYSVGAEFNYYPIQRFYLAGNFHAGRNPGKSGRYTRTEEEMIIPTYEYIGTIGVGYDIISTTHHILYAQAGAGAGYLNEKWAMTTSENNEVHISTYDAWSTKFAGMCAIGYDYRISDRFSIGANYSAWLMPSRPRSSANIRLSVWL